MQPTAQAVGQRTEDESAPEGRKKQPLAGGPLKPGFGLSGDLKSHDRYSRGAAKD